MAARSLLCDRPQDSNEQQVLYAGHFVDLSDRGCVAKVHGVAASHPQSVQLQSQFPMARSDFAVLEQQCLARERADIIGPVTAAEFPGTTKPKVNLWLKDLSGKELMVGLWGQKFRAQLSGIKAGDVLQIDNCILLKKTATSLEGSAEHCLDSDRHGFAYLHMNPMGSRADALRSLDTSLGESISEPWTPALGMRMVSTLEPCYVTCASTLSVCALAMADGGPQARNGRCAFHDVGLIWITCLS